MIEKEKQTANDVTQAPPPPTSAKADVRFERSLSACDIGQVHDELLAQGIKPKHVELDGNTLRLTWDAGFDLSTVAPAIERVCTGHKPKVRPVPPTRAELRAALVGAKSLAELKDALIQALNL